MSGIRNDFSVNSKKPKIFPLIVVTWGTRFYLTKRIFSMWTSKFSMFVPLICLLINLNGFNQIREEPG